MINNNNFKSKVILVLVSLIIIIALGIIYQVLALNPPTNQPPIGGGTIRVGSNAPDNSLYINSSGNVGIGTTTPVNKLDVSGNIGVSGNVTATAFYYGSDKSLKINIKPFDKSLQKILNLEPVYFDYKENNQHSLGFIAQDVEKQFPELVTTDSLTGLKSLDYSRLTAPLVMAIKEQQEQINALTQIVESQQQQINELKTQLNNLQQIVKTNNQ